MERFTDEDGRILTAWNQTEAVREAVHVSLESLLPLARPGYGGTSREHRDLLRAVTALASAAEELAEVQQQLARRAALCRGRFADKQQQEETEQDALQPAPF